MWTESTTRSPPSAYLFFFNDTATTEIYTLSLHDALPISEGRPPPRADARVGDARAGDAARRSEEHTSELQSPQNLVCRLLLDKIEPIFVGSPIFPGIGAAESARRISECSQPDVLQLHRKMRRQSFKSDHGWTQFNCFSDNLAYANSVCLMKDFAIDVRPKLPEDERAAVEGGVGDPALISLGEGALLAGVVKVGNPRR